MDDRLLPHDITTDRLMLRVPLPEDALELFNSYAQDPEVVRYLTWKLSKTQVDSRRHIEDRILAWRRGNICAWSIIQGGFANLYKISKSSFLIIIFFSFLLPNVANHRLPEAA